MDLCICLQTIYMVEKWCAITGRITIQALRKRTITTQAISGIVTGKGSAAKCSSIYFSIVLADHAVGNSKSLITRKKKNHTSRFLLFINNDR